MFLPSTASASHLLPLKVPRFIGLYAWLLFLLASNSAFAQAPPKPVSEQNTPASKGNSIQPLRPGLSDMLLSDIVLRKLLNREFSKILNPKATSAIGNFAAIDLAEASVSAAGTFNVRRGFLIIKAFGDVSDGLLPLFTDSKLNTGVELGAQYNWFVNNTSRIKKITQQHPTDDDILFKKKGLHIIEYSAESYDAYKKKLKEIDAAHRLSMYKATKNIDSALVELGLIKFKNERKKLLKLIEKNNAHQKEGSANLVLKTLFKARGDSLDFERFKLEQLITNDSLKIEDLPSRAGQRIEARNTKTLADSAAHDNIEVTGLRISWFSLGYSIKHSSFHLLDAAKSFAEQSRKETFVGHTFRFQYSRYLHSEEKNKSAFWTIGIAPSITNNLGDLTKKEVMEETSLDTLANRRYISEKYNAYEGDYKADRYALTIFYDYYRFLGKGNRLAIHLFPEHRIRENKLPTTNLGLGLFVAFQDQKKEKTIVNAELYANAVNVLGIGSPEDNVFKRGTAGIRFTFPIAFR